VEKSEMMGEAIESFEEAGHPFSGRRKERLLFSSEEGAMVFSGSKQRL
jgi:hypothetical protein